MSFLKTVAAFQLALCMQTELDVLLQLIGQGKRLQMYNKSLVGSIMSH